MDRVNSASKQQKTLFDRWKRETQEELILDGMVDAAKYWDSPRRLLFVLKEANYRGNEGWDLKDYVAKGEWSHTWNNITRWTRAIHALPEELSWKDCLSPIGKDARVKELGKIAFMNLNKRTGGTGVANITKIREAVEKDKCFIREQVEIYDPQYIICCGIGFVFDLTVPIILEREGERSCEETKRGVRYVKLPQGGHLIDYWHPQSRIQANLLCFPLVDAIREIEEGSGR
ncbi:MAG: hypothetical protein F4229_07455 [Gammaproteobacteria bacterium]|nr:hypothetical protein [Gammaproteobacteria bacterium]